MTDRNCADLFLSFEITKKPNADFLATSSIAAYKEPRHEKTNILASDLF